MEDKKIQDLQVELRSILEIKVQSLSKQVRESEEITRQIITTELQLKTIAEKKERQLEERSKLEIMLKKDQQELFILEGVLEKLRLQNSGISDLKSQIANEEQDIRRQEEELQSLQQESTLNQSKIQSLQENIKRMKEMVDTQMMSVMDLTNELRDITSGNTMVTGKPNK